MSLLMVSACSLTQSKVGSVTATPSPAAHPTPTATPRPTYPAPVIVQIENDDLARPQAGLSGASIIYDYVAEGGVARISAVFFHPPQGLVGPVRSSRTVTIELTRLYGAILMYSGASQYMLNLLYNSGLHNFDEDSAGGDLFRVYTATRYAPHNLMTDTSHMTDLVNTVNPMPVNYSLWQRANPTFAGQPVNNATAFISWSEQPVFTWNNKSQAFTVTEPDGLLTDSNTGKPVLASTVIIQQVSVTEDPNVVDVNGTFGVDQGVTGSGSAQVLSFGQSFNANWSQGPSGPPKFTLSDGNPAPIGAGLVWICLVPAGSPAQLSAPAPWPQAHPHGQR